MTSLIVCLLPSGATAALGNIHKINEEERKRTRKRKGGEIKRRSDGKKGVMVRKEGWRELSLELEYHNIYFSITSWL